MDGAECRGMLEGTAVRVQGFCPATAASLSHTTWGKGRDEYREREVDI